MEQQGLLPGWLELKKQVGGVPCIIEGIPGSMTSNQDGEQDVSMVSFSQGSPLCQV